MKQKRRKSCYRIAYKYDFVRLCCVHVLYCFIDEITSVNPGRITPLKRSINPTYYSLSGLRAVRDTCRIRNILTEVVFVC
jgi:hypothetical protein